MCPSIWLDLWTIRVITLWEVTAIKHSLDKGRKKLQPTVNLLEISKSRDLTWLCWFLHFTEMQRDPPRRPQFCFTAAALSKAPALVPAPQAEAATLLGAGTGLGMPGSLQQHPGPGPGSLQHSATSRGSQWHWELPQPRMEQHQEQTPHPAQPGKPSAKHAELQPGRTYGHLTTGTSASPPWVIPMSGSCSSCTHTLFTGILQQEESFHPAFTRKAKVFVGIGWKRQHRCSAGVTVSTPALTAHSWTYITCEEPGELSQEPVIDVSRGKHSLGSAPKQKHQPAKTPRSNQRHRFCELATVIKTSYWSFTEHIWWAFFAQLL